MRIGRSTPQNSSVKIKQSQLDQRQLEKMRNNIKKRKRIYGDTEYNNIHFRIRQCEQHVKASRSQAIREEAARILRRRHSQQQKKKDGQYNVKALKQVEERLPNFRPNRRSKTQLSTSDATILEYQLSPNNHRYSRQSASPSGPTTPSREDAMRQQKIIKLSKEVYLSPTLNTYQGKHSPQLLKRLVESRKDSRVLTEEEASPERKSSFYRARERELARIGRQERGIDRNDRLKHMYNKYQLRAARGDDDAMALMHRSNMLRADALLELE